MKKKLLLITLILFSKLVIAQDHITSEIIQDVFYLKYNNCTASGFFVKHDNQTYLITAKHFVDSINHVSKISGDTISINAYQDSTWKLVEGTVYFHDNKNIDIAAIKTKDIKIDSIYFGLTSKGMIYGDEGYFLGFPFGINIMTDDSTNLYQPIPLVKRALLSAFYRENGVSILLLDAHNNPGFSGGPIVFKNYDIKNPYKWNVIGVVSAYRQQINTYGNLKYAENSGIMIGFNIVHAVEIMEKYKNAP